MQSLNLEITKYNAVVDGEPKQLNQVSFSVENIRTMEDWQELVGRVGDIIFNLNSKFEPVSGSH